MRAFSEIHAEFVKVAAELGEAYENVAVFEARRDSLRTKYHALQDEARSAKASEQAASNVGEVA